jgi:UDP-N-acetylmuramate--alanine ligase
MNPVSVSRPVQQVLIPSVEALDLPPLGELQPFPRVPRRVHLLGAGGAGVSGAARLLVEHGHVVTGHDRAHSEHVELLKSLGVGVEVDPTNAAPIPADAELVVRSAAIPVDDPRLRAVAARSVPVLKYAELLALVTPERRTLAVAGTHGKTTTSWFLFHALAALTREFGESLPRPGALVGGICRRLNQNATSAARGGWFSVEACEYDRSFLQLSPFGAVITNVEADHLDYYGTLDAIRAAFSRFADRLATDGLLVVGSEVPRTVEEASRAPVWRFGRELVVSLRGERAGRFAFDLSGPGFSVANVELSIPGAFNVENASLALALAVGTAARERGIDLSAAARAAARGIAGYSGAKRRFETWFTVGGTTVVHDYAHHPTEVRVTLEAARRALPGRPLHVLFQPHQHSRTARFFDDFVEALRFADRVVVADVYGARAHIDGEHTAGASELAQALVGARVPAVWGGKLATSVKRFVEALPEDCAALVMGAGDVEECKDELRQRLAVRRSRPRGSRR